MKKIDKSSLHFWQNRNYDMNEGVKRPDEEMRTLHFKNIVHLDSTLYSKDMDTLTTSLFLDEERKSYANVSKNFVYRSEQMSQIKNSALWKSSFSDQSFSDMKCIKACLSAEGFLENDINQHYNMKLLPSSTSVTSPQQHFSRQVLQSSENGILTNSSNNGNIFTSAVSPQYGSYNSRPPTKEFSKKRRADDENSSPESQQDRGGFSFRSAREVAIEQNGKKNDRSGSNGKKSLGSRPRNQCFSKFIPPNRDRDEPSHCSSGMAKRDNESTDDVCTHPKLKGIDKKLVELILSEIMDHGPPIQWDDIAGLNYAKATIKEIVVWPMLRPDLFTGLRGPPKGILLFGPPGTGKTLIGKCIACQSGATFFSISASSLTSKWIGEGEKMVRALFAVASMHQPAVIFIDEIDSLLSQRSETEHEASRRIKTEFLVQLDGATTSSDERILVVGATNRPQEIDEAARRRMVKRLYIPLPDDEARMQIIVKLLTQQPFRMTEDELKTVVERTDGYSGADVANLCKEAALGPIRSLQIMDITHVSKDDVRPIEVQDFDKALRHVKATVSKSDLTLYEEWNKTFGCGSV